MTSSWTNLREFEGSRVAAFEELCSQLARHESPVGADFTRTGNPDAGVEAFCTLSDGTEWGWQAKFFETSLSPTQWNQLDRSVRRALDAHPRLTRYFLCVPRDRADGRQPGIRTEMQKWHERAAKWRSWAIDRDMDVDYVWWGTSELWERLSLPEQAGRLKFWFGDSELFMESWFRGRLDEAIASAGPRYTPELHVDLPIARTLEFFGRTSGAGESLQQLANDIRGACTYEIRQLPTEVSPNGDLALDPLIEACDEVTGALADFDCPPDHPWRFSDVCEKIQHTLGLADHHHETLAAAQHHYDDAHPVGDPVHSSRPNRLRDAGLALRHLENQLRRTQDNLRHREPIVNGDLLIVTGDAGTGKTHLLCDVATDRISRGLPTVVLMGQRFRSKADPWTQVLQQLDLSSSSADEFVGALEAAAQAAECRALVIIDAINEGEGDAIWREHLAPFLVRLRRSPWIGTVLSVRTPYLERVINSEVLQTAYELEHHGFADSTYAAVQRYCEHFELEFPTTPLLRPEFDNPLFLKTLCEGLRRAGQRRFPVGAEGITKVFDRYLDGVNAEIADSLDLDRHTATVRSALHKFAAELADRRTYWMPRGEAVALINAFALTDGFSRSLYRALVDNGLLIEVPRGGQESEVTVQVGFEWFADRLIASHIVASHETPNSLAEALDSENVDGIAFALPWRPGLQDAFTVLVPERQDVELLDVFWDDVSGPSLVESFFRTLPWRDPDTIGPRCIELVDTTLEEAEEYERRCLLDALVTCATIPGHPLGAEFLDDHLRRIPMPDRDATWSTYLHYTYGQDGPVDRLLDWAEGLHATGSAADPESAEASAVVLAWFLTASNRFVRDRATKCLVVLLHENFDLATDLVHRFRNVDDAYVYERVMAAAYGITMRSTNACEMASLAEAVYRHVFAEGRPPAHYLMRDYARGIVERAVYLGAAIDIDRSRIEPPYESDWPHIPASSELEEKYLGETNPSELISDAERARWWIRHSVMEWDFARYIIGTNSSTASSSWLSIPLSEPRWQPRDEELHEHSVLRYETEPRLDLDIIQRYVLWRVLDLGWTSERFGAFDGRLRSLRRNTQKSECIGKKYQWIALHEILAHTSDQFQYRASYSDSYPLADYHGPWQGYRRDIDPSFIRPAVRTKSLPSNSSEEWWRSSEDFDWGDSVSAIDWLSRADELPDVPRLLLLTNNRDSTVWLRLDGHFTWKEPELPGHDQWGSARREIWINMIGYIVDRESASETVETLRAADIWQQRLPEPTNPRTIFFGEIGWSPGFRDAIETTDEGTSGEGVPHGHVPPLRPAAMTYESEASEYDCSISEPVTLRRPDWRDTESMGLTWTGKGAEFKDAAGELAAFDPSARAIGPSSLLIRASDFSRFLEETESTLIWKVIGERMALRSGSGLWDGALKFSGIYEYTRHGPQGDLATELWLP